MSDIDVLRRAEAMRAFFNAVWEHGRAQIFCDMEDYGREPGDIVTVVVGLDTVCSRTGNFTADLVNDASARVREIEASAAPRQQGETR